MTEFLINTTTAGRQAGGRVAADADGDFVVVWESADGSGSVGIYGQRYNAAGLAQGGEFRVNTTTPSSQQNASVSMDASGDFVVVWESFSQDGSGFGIYGQRYNAAGLAQGSEFRVNTTTANGQQDASVAIEPDGDFVVVWASAGQAASDSGIYGQRYNAAGLAQGGEFRINTFSNQWQSEPSVSVDADGDFVAVWQSLGQDGSGNGIYGQRYNASGVAQGGEFRVNTTTADSQVNAHVSMDLAGNFVVVWSSPDGTAFDGSGLGIFGQRYNASGVAQGGEFRVNTTTYNSQINPRVSLDAEGDFVVVWDGNPHQDGSSGGVFGQRYNAAGVAQGGEFRVNSTTEEYQGGSSLAVDADGDFIAVWASEQEGSDWGIYGQRYSAGGVALGRAAEPPPAAAGAEFRVNTTTVGNQYSASLSADVDGDFVVVWASDALPGGSRSSSWDVYGQRYNAAGLAQGGEFRVNTATTNSQANASVALDADGDFVVVWQSGAQDGPGYGVYGQRFNAAGLAQGGEFRVNTTTADSQENARVSIDADGDFVVVWQSEGQDGSLTGIFGQRYNAAGVAQGGEFQVNTAWEEEQERPDVASSASGQFVVVWQSWGQDSSLLGIHGQRYNAAGVAQGDEFQINTTTLGSQRAPSVASSAAGDFVVVWNSIVYAPSGWASGTAIFGQRYNAAGLALGGEFRVDTTTPGAAGDPRVSMDADGDFVVVWEAFNQDGSFAGIYGQRYHASGVAQGREFRVNTTTANSQTLATASLDADGDLVVAWNSFGQDGSGDGIYGQRFAYSAPTTVAGTAGDDVLRGAAGLDTMSGGTGHDQYVINHRDDTVIENPDAGTDTAWVSTNGWTMPANVEILRLFGEATRASGSTGNNIMVANAGAASSLDGAAGNDELWGGAFAHTLNGGEGDDIIRGQDGAVMMIGGAGNDQFVVGHINATITENANEGTDTAWLAVNNWTNFAHVEIVRMAAPGVVRLTGQDGAEDLVANQAEASRIDARGGNDVLWGSAFADTLNGEAGDDIMRGQGGADVMAGGTGNDQYVVFNSAATVTEAANAGYDIVYFAGTGSFNIGENVEEARLSSSGTGLVGNALANLLVGNNAGTASSIDGGGGADTIWGTAAADTLIGGAGNDIIYSQGGADRILYNATGWGYDQVAGFTAGQAKIQFAADSGVTQFAQLALNSAGGNTQVEFGGFAILVFGMASMAASDFIFG